MNVDPRKSYASKVIVGFFGILLIGALVGAFIFVTVDGDVRDEQESTLEKQADIQANFTETQLRQELNFTDEITNTIRNLPDDDIEESEASLVGPHLETMQVTQNIKKLQFGEPGGDITASSSPVDRGESFEELGYLGTEAVWNQQEPAVSFRDAGSEPTWVFMAPAPFDGEDRVLVREIPAMNFVSDLDTIVPESATRIVNDEGTVVLDTNDPATIGTQHVAGGDSPAVIEALSGTSGIMRVDADESGAAEDVVVGYDRIGERNWVVVSYSEPSNLYALATSVGQHILLLLGTIGLMLVVFGLVVERPMVRSMSRLTDNARELRDGNLDVEIESDRSDDVGELFETFDAMRISLQERIQEVEAALKEVEVARKEAEHEREEAEHRRKHLQKSADRYGETMGNCADGDLTQRLDPDEENEAMENIAEEFNYMMDQIEATVGQVNQFSDEVSNTSEVVFNSTSELEDASAQIAESAQVISEETKTLQHRIETVSADLDAFIHEVDSADGDESTDGDEPVDGESTDGDEPVDGDLPLDELQELSDALSELAEQTSETLSESENIAAATEEQTAALTEVTATARELDRSARPLADLLNQFEASDDHTFYFGEASGVERVDRQKSEPVAREEDEDDE